MRVLITGYRGFIGQNMVNALSNYDLALYEWGDGQVPLNVDWVIHLGAISSTTYTDVRQIMLQNYTFTKNLVDFCQLRMIPIQIASSASIYGPQNTTFREDDPPDPQNPYAWTKYLVEHYCQSLNPTAPIQLFRYFNVYGPHEDHKGDQASPQHKFVKQARETGKVRLFKGSDRFSRDFVPVETVIDTHVQFFKVKESGVWNVGTGQPKSFLEVAQEAGGKIEWIDVPVEIKGYQTYTCANLSKLENTLQSLNEPCGSMEK
jgi:ADP-L-glycero-D-manno-heptose 6-epimerase